MGQVGLCAAFFAADRRIIREVMDFVQHSHVVEKTDVSLVQFAAGAGHFSFVIAALSRHSFLFA